MRRYERVLGVMVFATTFNINVSYIVADSCIGGGNRTKPLTCRKSLTNFITYRVYLAMIEIRTHNVSGDRH